MNSPEELS